MKQQEETTETKAPESCCKSLSDVCARHPVDCDNCVNGRVCGQRKDMQAHPNAIRSCPHFTPVPGWKPKAKGKGVLDSY